VAANTTGSISSSLMRGGGKLHLRSSRDYRSFGETKNLSFYFYRER